MSILNIFKKKSSYDSLKEFKDKNGLSNKDLAELFQVSESYLSLVFSGKRSFGKKKILLISRITGIPLENLIK